MMYFKVVDPMMAVCDVEDFRASTGLVASTTLRNVLGNKTLSEILSEREEIAQNLQVSSI